MQRNDNLICQVPFTGLTIGPIGNIALCCASDSVSIGHISEIENLTKFFNGKVYDQIRENFSNLEYPEQCQICWFHHKGGRRARIDSYNRFKFTGSGLRFLEVTASNICNQMCATCSGKFSHKWAPYEKMAQDLGINRKGSEHRFYTDTYRMTKDDLEKVLDLIPNLQHLTLKGGEPFADAFNIKILEQASEINPDIRLEICTNFEILTDKVLGYLKKIPDHHIQASIDGTGDVYNWIRLGDFDTVANNVKKYYEATGKKVVPVMTISIYNWFNFTDVIKYFEFKDEVDRVSVANIVAWPKECSPLYLSEKAVEKVKSDFREFLKDCKIKVSDPWQVLNLKSENEDHKYEMREWIEFCEQVRPANSEILQLVPELEEEL